MLGGRSKEIGRTTRPVCFEEKSVVMRSKETLVSMMGGGSGVAG